MFAALVELRSDKVEPVRAAASAILAPAYQPTGGSNRAPAGWWENWLAETTAKEAGYLKDFEVCSGDKAAVEGVDLFCKAGSLTVGYDLKTGQPVKKDPAAAFRQMSQAAEKGYVPAQAHLGMLYANGKGVEQDYRLARDWFRKAGEAGHALAKDNATYGRGVGGVRPPAVAPAPAQAK